jgi:hypothetical protein
MRRRWPLAAAALLLLTAGCSSDTTSGPTTTAAYTTTTAPPIAAGHAPVLVEEIRPAIAALESQLGGPQRFFEVNATPSLVNLFVATDGGAKAVAYVYTAGALQPPADPLTASGPTFGSADLAFDETLVLAQVVGSLPDSTVRKFAAVGLAAGGVRYVVTVESSRGGELDVDVSPTGAILSTDAMGGPQS